MPGPGFAVGTKQALRATAWVFLISLAAGLPGSSRAQSPEFRAFWVDAFHPGFKSASEVTTLINNVRRAHCNAVIVEVRKRGDAYYTPDTTYPDYEPHATDTSPAGFDSLADLIAKAHDTSGGKQRIEVHAWLVTWPIWGSQTPPADPQHPYNRHPEWLTRNESGTTWNGSQYCFDPGHPAAANHTFRIAINLVTNYALDGINFDYVRYAGNTWGYNPTAVGRFHARYGGSGNPAPTDPLWLQFRRDQITAFMRKVYLHTLADKPQIKVSADTITWAPGPASLADWSNTAAYKNVLQDWRAWLEEGILDLNIPMAYFDQSGPYTRDWTNWCDFTRDHQYQRHAVIGPGIYLNATADALTQIRYSRAASPAGNTARGVCAYSYAVPDKNGTSFSTFAGYLTNSPNQFDNASPGVFSTPAAIPPMPWKSSPSYGHLMGVVSGGSPEAILDGASLSVSGPVSRTQTSDGSGFYGFVDLPPGEYEVRATAPGLGTVTNRVTIGVGVVERLDLKLPAGVISDIVIDNPAASVAGSWSTGSSAVDRYGVDYRYKSPGSGGAYLQYTPGILRAGNYEVYEWHPAGANRTTNAAYAITHAAGTHTVRVNQEILGGRWNLLGTWSFEAGTAGFIRIRDDFPDSGQVTIADAIRFAYVPPPLPVITSAPQSRAGVPGGSASFSVTAVSSTAQSYQWKFNGAELPGHVDPNLVLLDLGLADFGAYAVRVSNDAGAVESPPAQLTLATSPTIVPGVAPSGNGVTLAFQTEAGPDYTVQFSDHPGNAPWFVLTNVAGRGHLELITDAFSTNTARVYRIKLQ